MTIVLTESQRTYKQEHARLWRQSENGKRYMRKYIRFWRQSKRIKVLARLGSRCSKCGWNEVLLLLQIHHAHGGGRKELRKLATSYDSYLEYVLLKLDHGSEDYILLCPNCNRKMNYANSKSYEESGWSTRYSRQVHRDIMNLLGGACVDCGERDPRILDITHIKGGGRKERNQLLHFRVGPYRYYLSILKKIKCGSKDYALRCVNCHAVYDYKRHQWMHYGSTA